MTPKTQTDSAYLNHKKQHSKKFSIVLIGTIVMMLLLGSKMIFADEGIASTHVPNKTHQESQISKTQNQAPIISLSNSVPEKDIQATLDCSANPFGNFHDLFLENEVFVGFTAHDPGASFFHTVSAELLDLGIGGGGKITLLEKGLFLEPDNVPMREHRAAKADLYGNGSDVFVQSARIDTQGWSLVEYSGQSLDSILIHNLSNQQYHHLAADAGDIIGSGTLLDQLVLAGVQQSSGFVNVILWGQTTASNNNANLAVRGRWSSFAGGRQSTQLLDVAVGNFTGNGQDDIAVVMKHNNGDIELVVLEYDANHDVGSGNEVEYKLKPINTIKFSMGNPTKIRLVAGRLNADFKDEIIMVYNDANADDQLIHINPFTVDPINREVSALTQLNKIITYQSGSLEMDAGMGEINGDYSGEELVVAYQTSTGLHAEVLGAQNLEFITATLGTINSWNTPWNDQRSKSQYLSANVGDLNNDGLDEIVLAYDDGRGLEVGYIDDSNLIGNNYTATINLDPTGLNTPTSIALGDSDNDSLRATYSGNCQEIREDNVNSVLFRPPLWKNIQAPVDLYGTGFIGSSTGSGSAKTTQLTYERSTVTSGYVGVGISVDYKLASFEASTKFTMASEYATSTGKGTETETNISDSKEFNSGRNFAVLDESTYYCYTFDLSQQGVAITDTTEIRSCEIVDTVDQSKSLDVRDAETVVRETDKNKLVEWIPTTRDWASIPLFCESCTSQSSTAGAGSAGKAVDGNLSGNVISMTSTTVENYPWWEVDLGKIEDITKIRVWNREDLASCSVSDCAASLSNFHVFVSDSPFSASDTPTDLLGDPNVHSYSLDSINNVLSPTVGADYPAGRVSTFLTLNTNITGTLPIQGQYVRVQINRSSAQLKLAEVQIFGANHVEPNQYPLDVRASTSDYFEVKMFNPYITQTQWVQVRGELLWDGYKNDGMPLEVAVTSGDSGTQWSRITRDTTTKFSSSSISEKNSVGYEFEFSGGAVALLQGGFGQEFSTGVFSEQTHSTSWTEEFEIGGWVKGFPQGGNGAPVITWYEQCEYRVRPYYYKIKEESTFGYTSSHSVLDYVIPQQLDRQANLQPCELGHTYNPTTSSANDAATGAASSSITLHPLLNDQGTEKLRILSVGSPQNGTATFTQKTITYTPNSGFTGVETLSYTAGDGTTTDSATIEVTVEEVPLYLPFVVR